MNIEQHNWYTVPVVGRVVVQDLLNGPSTYMYRACFRAVSNNLNRLALSLVVGGPAFFCCLSRSSTLVAARTLVSACQKSPLLNAHSANLLQDTSDIDTTSKTCDSIDDDNIPVAHKCIDFVVVGGETA